MYFNLIEVKVRFDELSFIKTMTNNQLSSNNFIHLKQLNIIAFKKFEFFMSLAEMMRNSIMLNKHLEVSKHLK